MRGVVGGNQLQKGDRTLEKKEAVCIKCGNTGKTAEGVLCDCGYMDQIILPPVMAVPLQYQNVIFHKSLLPKHLQGDYGKYMEGLIHNINHNLLTLHKNILVCAPPNSGKTVFAYTVYGLLFAKGFLLPKLMDLIEVRMLLTSYYAIDYEKFDVLSSAKVAIVKIPQDLPQKWTETISTLIERRVMNGCTTIFLFSGSIDDLKAQDRFGKWKSMIGDGYYHSIEVKNWS